MQQFDGDSSRLILEQFFADMRALVAVGQIDANRVAPIIYETYGRALLQSADDSERSVH